MPTQQAFVFAKPHANTKQVQALIAAKFAEVGITVISEGEVDGPTIDAKKYIDQQYVWHALDAPQHEARHRRRRLPRSAHSSQLRTPAPRPRLSLDRYPACVCCLVCHGCRP